jgi:hypothetical protein
MKKLEVDGAAALNYEVDFDAASIMANEIRQSLIISYHAGLSGKKFTASRALLSTALNHDEHF